MIKYFSAILLSIIVVLSCSKKSNAPNDSDHINKISRIYQNFLPYSGDSLGVNLIYDSLLESDADLRKNKELYYALNCSKIYTTKADWDHIVIKQLHQMLISDSYEQQHFLNQFYVNYFLAFEYAETLHIDNALKYGFYADSLLGNDPTQHVHERKLLKKLLTYTTTLIYSMEDEKIKNLEEDLKEMKLKGQTEGREYLRAHYNLAYYNSLKKNNRKVIYWGKELLKIAPTPQENIFYAEILDLISEAYLATGQSEMVKDIHKKMLNDYSIKKIPDEVFYKFLGYRLKYIQKFRSEYEFQTSVNKALKYYEPEPIRNRYHLTNIYYFLFNYYKSKGNDEMYVYYLKKNLAVLTRVKATDEFFISEEKKTLKELIDLASNKKEDRKLPEYIIRVNEIDSIFNKTKYAYAQMIKVQMQNDKEYWNAEFKDQMLIEDQTKQIKSFYLIILLFLVPVLITAIMFIRKNKKMVSKIQENYDMLIINNHHILDKRNQLKQMINRLEFSNKTLESFAYNAAKDLNSPITVIHENIDIINQKYEDIIEEDDKEIFEFLNSSTNDLHEMIDVLLNYSKKDKNIDKNEKINLAKILKNVTTALSERIEAQEAQIKFPDTIPEFYGNKALIEKLFQNLIANAIKFRKKDEKPVVEISFQNLSKNRIRFTIADNGIGISEENQRDIFKIFKKLHSKKEYEGSGIGLSTCKKIVNEFGGKIWVESKVGTGSKFHIILPIQASRKKREEKQFL